MDMLETILQYLENGYRYNRATFHLPDIKPEDTFDALVGRLHSAIQSAVLDTHRADEETTMYFCLGKWRLFKTAYSIHPEFLAALMDSEDTPLRAEIFRRLPCSSFYLECSKDPISGYVVATEAQENGDCLIAVTEVSGIDIDANKLCVAQASLWFRDGETVSQALARFLDELKGRNEDLSGYIQNQLNTIPDFASIRYLKPMSTVILAAYYLASENPDIRKIKTPKEKRPKDASGKRLNYRRWEVGYREGASIEKMLQQSEPAEPTGKSHKVLYKMRPHVRRAHWHHYWTGRGRQKLVVKWIAPILVNNTDESGGIIPTVHRSEFCKGD